MPRPVFIIGGLLALVAAGAAVAVAKSREIGAAVSSFLASGYQPCTSFVASFIMEQLGLVPEDATDWHAWWGAASELWEAISIWDDTDRWSGVEWVANHFGGPAQYASAVYTAADLPELEVGVDYMAQLWWSSTGHAIIVTRQADGLFRVRDSNTTRGYQDELVEAWGYSGADVGVAPIRA